MPQQGHQPVESPLVGIPNDKRISHADVNQFTHVFSVILMAVVIRLKLLQTMLFYMS